MQARKPSWRTSMVALLMISVLLQVGVHALISVVDGGAFSHRHGATVTSDRSAESPSPQPHQEDSGYSLPAQLESGLVGEPYCHEPITTSSRLVPWHTAIHQAFNVVGSVDSQQTTTSSLSRPTTARRLATLSVHRC